MQVPKLGGGEAILLVLLIVPATVFLSLNAIPRNSQSQETNVTAIQPVTWELEKSGFSSDFPLWFNNPSEVYGNCSYVSENANISVATDPCHYSVNVPGGSDELEPRVNLTATVATGYVEKVRLVFEESHNASEVRLDYGGRSRSVNVENLTVNDNDWAWSTKRWWLLEGNEKAWVQASCENESKHVEFDLGGTQWVLNAPRNLTQQLKVSAEVTFFNGTGDTEVVLPTLINLVADAGDTFDTARTITAGNYTGSVSQFFDPYENHTDAVDCYKIWLPGGRTISVSAITRQGAIELALYDSNQTLKDKIDSQIIYGSRDPIYAGQLGCTCDSDSYWYVSVQSTFDVSFYRMTVEVA